MAGLLDLNFFLSTFRACRTTLLPRWLGKASHVASKADAFAMDFDMCLQRVLHSHSSGRRVRTSSSTTTHDSPRSPNVHV